MPIHVKDGGVWKEATAFVRDGGVWKQANLSVRDGGTWKEATAVELTVSPTSILDSAASSSWTSGSVVATVVGGTPTSYTWSLVSPTGGTWSIASGQGTNTATVSVSGVAGLSGASVTLRMTAVVNGQNYTADCLITYNNTDTGGGPPGP